MESIRELSKNLNKCKNLSKKIIDYSLPIMININKKNIELIEDLLLEFPNTPSQKIFGLLEKEILEIISDSEKVLIEIDGFSSVLLEEGDKNIYSYENSFPFLVKVWSGDTYDQEKNNGLKCLIKELKEYKKIVVSEDDFINYIKEKKLSKN